jgi:hypothetical protein
MRLPTPPPSLVAGRFPAAQLGPELVEARRRLWFDDAAGRPLDVPGRLLTEYYADRRGSPLRRIVETANRWAVDLETVVLVCGGAKADVAQAIFEGAAHPYYNSLSHGARGGRPRLAIVRPVDDDDLLQGVLDLVRRTGESIERHDRWAVWIEGADDPAEGAALAATAAPLLAALAETAVSSDDARARTMVTTATGEPCQDFPADFPATFVRRLAYPTLWDGAGFAAAALCGADVVGLAKGMTWFAEEMKRRVPDDCPVARLVARIAQRPVALCTGHHALDGLANWFARSINASDAAGSPTGSARVTVVPAWQSDERRRFGGAKSFGELRPIHLVCETPRRDRLHAAQAPAARATAGAAAGSDEPSTDERAEIRIKRLNEVAIGELCAWLSAAKLLYDATR